MLKTIRLKNFKLHEDTSIEAAPITVFIGPNNSGKSSIFQALLLLRQAAARNDQFLCRPPGGIQPPPSEHYLYSPNLLVDVGAFDEVVRRGRNEIDFQVSGGVRPPRTIGDLNEASLSFETRIKENWLVSNSGSIRCPGGQTEWEFVGGKPTKGSPGLKWGEVIYRLEAVGTFNLTRLAGFSTTNPVLSQETMRMYNEFSQWIGAIPSKLLQSLHPVYALRGFEEWGYPITDYSPSSLELLTLHDRALALPNALASDRRLKERLSERLEEILHISIDFEVIPGKRLKIWAKPTGNSRAETLFANEGTGANQIPFIFVPVLLTPPDETILLSEPEAHLHPKGQCELTSMLLSVAKKENIQFFFETHSEHVLHTILNSVARGEWSPADVALYYFQNKNGIAEVGKREINQFGQVDGGLPDFFEQSLAELSDYLKALSKT